MQTIEERAAVADAWRRLLVAVLYRAVRDGRNRRMRAENILDARLFLLEPGGAWLMDLAGWPVRRRRERIVDDWCQREIEVRIKQEPHEAAERNGK